LARHAAITFECTVVLWPHQSFPVRMQTGRVSARRRYRWSTDSQPARKLTWSGISRARDLAAAAQDACKPIKTARYRPHGHPDGIVRPDDNT